MRSSRNDDCLPLAQRTSELATMSDPQERIRKPEPPPWPEVVQLAGHRCMKSWNCASRRPFTQPAGDSIARRDGLKSKEAVRC